MDRALRPGHSDHRPGSAGPKADIPCTCPSVGSWSQPTIPGADRTMPRARTCSLSPRHRRSPEMCLVPQPASNVLPGARSCPLLSPLLGAARIGALYPPPHPSMPMPRSNREVYTGKSTRSRPQQYSRAALSPLTHVCTTIL